MFRIRTAIRWAESKPSGDRFPLDVGVCWGRSVGTTSVGTGPGGPGSMLQPPVRSSSATTSGPSGASPHRSSSRWSAALASVAWAHTDCTSDVNRARSSWSYWAEFCRYPMSRCWPSTQLARAVAT